MMSNPNVDNEDKVQKLYMKYEMLSRKDIDATESEEVYREILSSVKGTTKEKILVSQFIPTFFDSFLSLSEEALAAYLNLCEDKDINVRKESIKRLPRLFNGQPNDYSKRFAEILSQLLIVEDASEKNLACASLVALLKSDPAGSLKGVFNQIKNGKDSVREAVFKFLASKIRKVNSGWSVAAQDVLISEIKTIFPEACPEEIPVMFGMLLSTRLGKTSTGRKQILDIFLSYIESDKEALLINDSYSLRRLISFIRNARALFSPDIHSNKYFLFFSKEVIPVFLSFSGSREGSGCCLWLLRLFAEITNYTKDLTDIDECIKNILSLALEFLPSPSAPDSRDAYKNLQFSSVECLLSALHQALKHSPNFFHYKPDTLRDLRLRLLYFSRASRAYAKLIEETIKRNKKNDMERIKLAALRTIININLLLKDFFRDPPDLSANIILSWVSSDNSHLKRKATDDSGRTEKLEKVEPEGRQYTYQPPIGKYSQHLHLNNSNEWPNI